MNFIQPNFLLFLLAFCLVYRLLGQRGRVSLGIIGSFYFYAYFSPIYALLLIFSSAIDHLVGLKLYGATRHRRSWLTLSLVANLGILVLFKYDDLIWNTIAAWVPDMGMRDSGAPPMGISFFTFQTMSYTIDIYRGQLQPCRRFREFLFYVSFFPQLVAGPIVRARDFLPQIQGARLALEDIRPCLLRFARGFVKKACLADGLGVLLVDPVYADPASSSPPLVALAIVAYGLQLYLDFSGYSDMAIALGKLLGFTFPENFNYPYLARSFSDFWKRWHISLSSWLRDYLYISLGGNRVSANRVMANLMITMLLGGLWHGADWSFVVWGGLNGLYLVIEHRWGTPLRFLGAVGGFLWVVGAYFFSLIFFRANTMGDALEVLAALGGPWMALPGGLFAIEAIILLGLSMLISCGPLWRARFSSLVLECRILLSGVFLFLAFHFYPSGVASPFIYFQF